MRVLVSWLGHADIRAPDSEDRADVGPVAQAILSRQYESVLLLADQERGVLRKYEGWLRTLGTHKRRLSLKLVHVELTNPTNFGEIYSAVTRTLESYVQELAEQPELTFHLSPGTPAMAAIWVILGKTRYRAELIQSSRQKGVETASVPFDITLSPDFVTDVLRMPDTQLQRLSGDRVYNGRTYRKITEATPYGAAEGAVAAAAAARPRRMRFGDFDQHGAVSLICPYALSISAIDCGPAIGSAGLAGCSTTGLRARRGFAAGLRLGRLRCHLGPLADEPL
jgi:hypothetical protein